MLAVKITGIIVVADDKVSRDLCRSILLSYRHRLAYGLPAS